MRLVSIKDILEDEMLAQPIYDIDGRRLLNRGIRLKPRYVQKLYEKGVYSVYIEDSISEGIEIDETLCSQTRMHAKQVVNRELERFSKTKEFNIQNLNNTVNDMLEEMLSSRIEIVNLKEVRLQDEYLFAHSVNVCALSILLASNLGYNKEKIKNIGMGALLHDFGKILVSSTILEKEDSLTPDEQKEMNQHPLYGYNMLKDDSTLSSTSKIAVLMHHEKLDGSGYPLGLTEDKIHYSARIVSICSLFDSITCDRKFKNALSTADAVEYISCSAGNTLDKSFVNEFLHMIPIFPSGTLVLLSNGIIGIVISNHSKCLTRPVVKLLYNPKTKAKYGKNHIIDLMKELSIKIIREIHIPAQELKENTSP